MISNRATSCDCHLINYLVEVFFFKICTFIGLSNENFLKPLLLTYYTNKTPLFNFQSSTLHGKWSVCFSLIQHQSFWITELQEWCNLYFTLFCCFRVSFFRKLEIYKITKPSISPYTKIHREDDCSLSGRLSGISVPSSCTCFLEDSQICFIKVHVNDSIYAGR